MAPALVADLDLPANPVREADTPHATQASIPKLFSLENKTVAITGAARGLGIVLALAVVEAGGNAACMDILDTPAAEEWAKLNKVATAAGCYVSYQKCDVTDEASMEQAMNEIAAAADAAGATFHGTIACAGVQQALHALDYPAADFDRIMKVNVTGVFNTCKYAAKALRARNLTGSIVIIASMSGRIANRGILCTAYNSSKAACVQMTRSLAQEWGQYGIRVNSLSPGYIRTAMTDKLLADDPAIEKLWMGGALLGRLGNPEDFKAPAVFLLAPGASWVHGSDLLVDGGHCASA